MRVSVYKEVILHRITYFNKILSVMKILTNSEDSSIFYKPFFIEKIVRDQFILIEKQCKVLVAPLQNIDI